MHEAAAVITFLSPGLRFFHQGQFEARKKRISPHLIRAPEEAPNPAIAQFYERLLAVLREPAVRQGDWCLAECVPAWESNWSSDCFIVHAWQGGIGPSLLATVNYAPNQSQCYVHLPFADLEDCQRRLQDLLGSASYDRDGNDLKAHGLYLDVPGWQSHIFSISKRQ